MASSTNADIRIHGMPVLRPLFVDQTVTGWIAVSLYKPKMGKELFWLNPLTQETLAGKSINLYHIGKEP